MGRQGEGREGSAGSEGNPKVTPPATHAQCFNELLGKVLEGNGDNAYAKSEKEGKCQGAKKGYRQGHTCSHCCQVQPKSQPPRSLVSQRELEEKRIRIR